MIGCCARLGDDARVPGVAMGALFTLPAISASHTSKPNLIIFWNHQKYSGLQANREVTFQATHLHLNTTLNILPQQEASDNRFRSLHSGRTCKSYHPSIPHLEHRPAFCSSTQLVLGQVRPLALSDFLWRETFPQQRSECIPPHTLPGPLGAQG